MGARETAELVVMEYVDPGAVADRVTAVPRRPAPVVRQRGRTGTVAVFNPNQHPRGPGGKFALAPGGSQQTAERQDALRKQGLYGGRLDGLHGPKTTAAVKAFQAKYGLTQSGKIDAATAATLAAPPPKDAVTAKAELDKEIAAANASGKKKGRAKGRSSGSGGSSTRSGAGGNAWQGQIAMSGVLRRGSGTTTKRGSSSSRGNGQVKQVQAKLLALGYDLGDAGPDGRFGKATEDAIRMLQRDYGLKPDGIVGLRTKTLLNLLGQAESQRAKDPNALSLDQMALSSGGGSSASAAAQAVASGMLA